MAWVSLRDPVCDSQVLDLKVWHSAASIFSSTSPHWWECILGQYSQWSGVQGKSTWLKFYAEAPSNENESINYHCVTSVHTLAIFSVKCCSREEHLFDFLCRSIVKLEWNNQLSLCDIRTSWYYQISIITLIGNSIKCSCIYLSFTLNFTFVMLFSAALSQRNVLFPSCSVSFFPVHALCPWVAQLKGQKHPAEVCSCAKLHQWIPFDGP